MCVCVFDFSTAYKCRCTRKGPKIRYKDVQKLEIKLKHPFCHEKMILWDFFLLSYIFLISQSPYRLLSPFSPPLLLSPYSSHPFHAYFPWSLDLFLNILFLPFLFSPTTSVLLSPCAGIESQYLYLSDTQIYNCNSAITVFQNTWKHSSVVQALSKHIVVRA